MDRDEVELERIFNLVLRILRNIPPPGLCEAADQWLEGDTEPPSLQALQAYAITYVLTNLEKGEQYGSGNTRRSDNFGDVGGSVPSDVENGPKG